MQVLRIILLATFTFLFVQPTDAQILKDIVRKTTRRLGDKAEDMVAEALAEAIARQLQKKIDNYFEEMARESYRQDSIARVERGDTLVYANYQEMMSEMLANMNNTEAIQDEYTFDLLLDVEISSGKETDESRFLYSRNAPVFAVEQYEKKDKSTMLFDLENDVIVLFSEDSKGKKTAQALPNFMGMAAAMSQSSEALQPISISKGSQTKNIAGYTCQEYLGEDEEHTFQFFATPELAEYWQNGMGEFMQRFTSYEYNSEVQKIDGMVMESVIREKKAEKKSKRTWGKKAQEEPEARDSWTVTRVDKSGLSLKKADYEFVGFEEEK